jgi:hypothetical protein
MEGARKSRGEVTRMGAAAHAVSQTPDARVSLASKRGGGNLDLAVAGRPMGGKSLESRPARRFMLGDQSARLRAMPCSESILH